MLRVPGIGIGTFCLAGNPFSNPKDRSYSHLMDGSADI
jgi:hypothetical protein